jgi:hypothetical protein
MQAVKHFLVWEVMIYGRQIHDPLEYWAHGRAILIVAAARPARLASSFRSPRIIFCECWHPGAAMPSTRHDASLQSPNRPSPTSPPTKTTSPLEATRKTGSYFCLVRVTNKEITGIDSFASAFSLCSSPPSVGPSNEFGCVNWHIHAKRNAAHISCRKPCRSALHFGQHLISELLLTVWRWLLRRRRDASRRGRGSDRSGLRSRFCGGRIAR